MAVESAALVASACLATATAFFPMGRATNQSAARAGGFRQVLGLESLVDVCKINVNTVSGMSTGMFAGLAATAGTCLMIVAWSRAQRDWRLRVCHYSNADVSILSRVGLAESPQ